MMNYRFIGWCQQGTSDKVWGVIRLEPTTVDSDECSHVKCAIFWGRRGSRLQTLISVDNKDITKLIDSKTKKGYQSISSDKLNLVYPEFQDDLEKTAIWAVLTN